MGSVVKTWLTPKSRSFEVANAIMTAPGVFGNNTGHTTPPVIAKNNSVVDDYICEPYKITRTVIEFKRNQGDLPALSFYANVINRGSVYFEVRH
jgi:hypothetical protein